MAATCYLWNIIHGCMFGKIKKSVFTLQENMPKLLRSCNLKRVTLVIKEKKISLTKEYIHPWHYLLGDLNLHNASWCHGASSWLWCGTVKFESDCILMHNKFNSEAVISESEISLKQGLVSHRTWDLCNFVHYLLLVLINWLLKFILTLSLHLFFCYLRFFSNIFEICSRNFLNFVKGGPLYEI